MRNDNNHISISGQVTRKPKLRRTRDELRVYILFTLAIVNYDRVIFFDVKVWGRDARRCARCLGEGSRVEVEGRLDQWWPRNRGEMSLIQARRVRFLER
jgi:single-stranded DNA-binding protein